MAGPAPAYRGMAYIVLETVNIEVWKQAPQPDVRDFAQGQYGEPVFDGRG